MSEYDPEIEEVDVEPFEGEPDFDRSQAIDDDGVQDDLEEETA